MPSSFPGMDPYLEDPARWPDVHHSLITYIRNALQPQVRPRYYHCKQQDILNSAAHLIEIDLLAEGLLTVAILEEGKDSLPPHRYLVSVNRAPDKYRFEMYPIPLQRRLPRFRVPLREPDPDVPLDLQAMFTRCYDDGGYTDFVDYRQPPPVLLSPEEVAWVDGLLKGKGLRDSSA
jgi:hypothetical protein